MSPLRQIAIVVAVLVVAGGAWVVYDRGWFTSGDEGASAAQPQGVGQPAGPGRGQTSGQAGGPPAGRGGPGGAGGGAPVVTAVVETDATGLEVRAVGTVAAARAVTLYPEATGVVVELTFRPGSQVAAGQPLIRLDDSEQQVAVDRARVALDAAKVTLDRSEQLARSSNITTVALNDARTAVQRAEIDLRGAELELARRTLVAPFAGTIGLTDVTVGDLVNSQKAIATLDDMSTVTVAFEVPERASGRVAVGQELTATTAALAGRGFTGNITAVDSRVDPVARTLKVEASLPNEASVLKPGMALNVVLEFPGEEHPAVPSMAVQWDRNGPYVWKVDGDTVARADVDIVGRRSGIVVVAGGVLSPGTEVVVEGLQRMREGARISRIVEPGGPPVAAPAAGSPEAEATAPVRRQPSG
jgi:RND family efflux transporter MFP subunit